MKTHKLLNIIVLLGLVMLLAYPQQPVSASRINRTHRESLHPISIETESGNTVGEVSQLLRRDQGGQADRPDKYVLFETPSTVYRGYRTYALPPSISPGDVRSMVVEANYKGPVKVSQEWSWYLYDWVQNTWIKVGDNEGIRAGKWQLLRFEADVNPARFVHNLTREIRLQLVSNNDAGDAKLDYENITVMYNPCKDPLGCVTVGASDPIHIAYLLALNFDFAIDSRNGVEVAIDDAGGQILNHDIQFDGRDGGCNLEDGLVAGQNLAVDASIVAVVGTSCSDEARAAMPVLSQAGFVVVSPSNTGSDLTEPGNPNNHPGYLRVSWSDRVQGAAAAQFAWEYLGVTTAATIYDGSWYSVYLQQAFADAFISLGGTISIQEQIDPEQTDMSAMLARIASGSPGLIYMPIFLPAGGFVIDQARDTPGLGTTYLLSSDSLYTPEVVTTAGDDVEGFMVTSPDPSAFSPDYWNHFVPAYLAKFGYEPTSIFSPYGYDAFMMIKGSIEKVALVKPDGTIQIGRQALRDAMYSTSNFAGLTGNLTCTPTGDCADPHIAVYEYHTGEYPPEKIWP